MEKYRPSNGSEGESFMAQFCERCIHEDWEEKNCPIIGLTMAYWEDEPEYPSEWTYDKEGKPTCTKFELAMKGE